VAGRATGSDRRRASLSSTRDSEALLASDTCDLEAKCIHDRRVLLCDYARTLDGSSVCESALKVILILQTDSGWRSGAPLCTLQHCREDPVDIQERPWDVKAALVRSALEAVRDDAGAVCIAPPLARSRVHEVRVCPRCNLHKIAGELCNNRDVGVGE
jgi:hypothetical protein